MKIENLFTGESLGEIGETQAGEVAGIFKRAQNFASLHRRGEDVQPIEVLARVGHALDAASAEIIDLLSAETGMPAKLASESFRKFMFSLRRASSSEPTQLMEHAGEGGTAYSFTRKFPLGIAAAFTSFSDPLGSLSRSLFPALKARVPMIIKPSSLAALPVLRIVKIVQESGFSDGEVQAIVTRHASNVLEPIVHEDHVSYLSCSGSQNTCLGFQERHPLLPKTFELYSCSTAVVMRSADVDLAASAIARSFTRFQGQAPGRIQRVLIDAGSFDYLANRIAEELTNMVSGDPSNSATDFSKLRDRASQDEFVSITHGNTSSASGIMYGGGIRDGIPVPLVLEHSERWSHMWERDLMLPFLVIKRFSSDEEAIAAANSSPSTWTCFVYTDDLNDLNLLTSRLDSSRIVVNSQDAQWEGGKVFFSGYPSASFRWITESGFFAEKEVKVSR